MGRGSSFVIALLLVIVILALTAVLQLLGWINLVANLTDVWLFFAVFPVLSLVAVLVARGIENTALRVQEQTINGMSKGMTYLFKRDYERFGRLKEIDFLTKELSKNLTASSREVQSEKQRLVQVLTARREVLDHGG
jgi:signal transduction histidine kinase